jgi:hypothetical protein
LTEFSYREGDSAPYKRVVYTDDEMSVAWNPGEPEAVPGEKQFEHFSEACEHIEKHFRETSKKAFNIAISWQDLAYAVPEEYWAYEPGNSFFIRIRSGYMAEKVTFPGGQIHRTCYTDEDEYRPANDLLRACTRFDTLESAIQASIDYKLGEKGALLAELESLEGFLKSSEDKED